MTTRNTSSHALREEMVGALLIARLETTPGLSPRQAVEIADALLPTVQRHVDQRRFDLITRLLMEAADGGEDYDGGVDSS